MIDAPLGAALAFARLGLAVVPVWPPMEKVGKIVCSCGKVDCKSPGKHPIARLGKSGPILAPNGVNSASTDRGIIKHWWQLAPLANIGVSTRNLIPLDIDARHDGLASLAALEEENGKLPPTWTVITGSGGFHYYFRRPEGLDLSPPIIAENIVRSGGVPPLGVGIDIPSYLVAPPSRHFTGGFYRWKVDGDPHQVPLGDAPGWMVERLTRTATKEKTRVATVPVEWAKLTDEATSLAARIDAARRLPGVAKDGP